MRIVFSDHAQQQLKERALSRSLVIETLHEPDQIIEGRFGRKVAQRVVQQEKVQWLFRVVYAEEDDRLVIVTVYRTAKVSKYFWR